MVMKTEIYRNSHALLIEYKSLNHYAILHYAEKLRMNKPYKSTISLLNICPTETHGYVCINGIYCLQQQKSWKQSIEVLNRKINKRW